MLAASFNCSLKQIDQVVQYLKKKIPTHAIIFLRGDLAAGKTTFVQHFADSSSVTSPTFSLQNIYSEGIYHYDLYTIDTQKFMDMGLVYELEKEGLHFIEWGDEKLQHFCKEAGFETFEIEIEKLDGMREYKIYES
ncbi:MAG: tRNA (adenosine(37)-N6)-threonylcarbamoyltransferase complex ATPase subunit type 1 TsaE [Campylobacterota bacterium]